MKLSFTTLGCPKWTLRQIVENAARTGFAGVDIRGLLDDIDVTRRPEFTTDLNKTKQLFADHGVAITGIYTSARFAVVEPVEKETQLAEARRNMEIAARLGAPLVRIYGGRVPERLTVDKVMPILVDNLLQIGEEAEEYDVTLALETHDDWTDSEVCARLMAQVSHPRVRMLWDLHHPYRFNGEPPEATYGNLASYTVNIHVKDSILDMSGQPRYVLLGDGDVPVKKILEMLLQGGYEGYATLEWEKRWHPELAEPEAAFPHFVKKMREWLK